MRRILVSLLWVALGLFLAWGPYQVLSFQARTGLNWVEGLTDPAVGLRSLGAFLAVLTGLFVALGWKWTSYTVGIVSALAYVLLFVAVYASGADQSLWMPNLLRLGYFVVPMLALFALKPHRSRQI